MGVGPVQARLMARMGYAQLIGIQHLPTLVTPEDATQMDHTLYLLLSTQGMRP
jgi:hypothetical protein